MKVASFGLRVALLLAPISVWACPTCGQSFSFTPKLLLISTGFFLLPLSIVGFIAWRVWKDEKNSRGSE